MDESRDRRKSYSRSADRDRRDKDRKKKKKHHDRERDRSQSHHKKKKKHSSPDRKEKDRSPKQEPKPSEMVEQKRPVEKEKSLAKEEREPSEKHKKRKDSHDSFEKKKKKKEKKERRDDSLDSVERSRHKKKKRDYDDDQYRSSRRDDHYRSDRRRRSTERRDYRRKRSRSMSEVKENPEQLEKLAQLKAAKELVSSKADRKLYLGNLPPNITSQQLMDMLNSALKKMDINTDVEGDSIVSAWISPDGVGHYAFVEFRTALQATNGLTLNGASLFGYQLKLGRPKQYIEYNKALLSEIGTDKNMETILKKVAALGKEQLPPIEERIVSPPSKIVVLKHIVSIQELGIDEEFDEILQDVKEMAKRFGEVVDIYIPRPHQTINLELAPTRVKGLGLIFIEYKTVTDARCARRGFVQKEFSGRPVACCFFDEAKFRQRELDIQDKVIIDF